MAIKWERDTVPGVYRREGVRGRDLFRHVYRNTDGKQVACSQHENITSARKHQREMLVAKPEPISRATLRETYDQLVADAGYADATLDLQRAAWKHIAHLADVPAGRITPKQVSDALKAVPGSEMRSKVRYLLTTLGAPVLIERKPNTRARKMEEAPKPLRTITSPELARLVEEMPERYHALLEIMAYQGLRPGEAVNLRVGDFDPLRRTLTVERALGGLTKTGLARSLVLPAPIVEMLNEHLAKFSDPTNPEAPMFTTESGGAIDSKFAYDAWSRRHFASAVQRAGMTTKISPNDLRHYAVKFAIGQGATVFAVQRMLGHAKPSITFDIYGSEWETSAEELAIALDEPIRQARAERPEPAKVVRLG